MTARAATTLAAALLALVVAVAGCGGRDDTGSTRGAEARAATFATVGVSAVASRVQRGDVLLVDVREPAEWAAGHAPRARHVPLGEVAARLEEIRAAADGRPVAFICRTGNRSAQAAEAATRGGLRRVLNVDGGMGAWVSAGLALRPAGGRVI